MVGSTPTRFRHAFFFLNIQSQPKQAALCTSRHLGGLKKSEKKKTVLRSNDLRTPGTHIELTFTFSNEIFFTASNRVVHLECSAQSEKEVDAAGDKLLLQVEARHLGR
jgi:hypothetical protein